jgi:hypothetical protein
VDLVQRNAVQLQPLRTAALTLFDHRWEWCNRKGLAGHRNLGARVSECLVEDALTLTHPVYLGRIEKRDPQIKGALHDVTGGTGGVTVPVAPLARAELPGAQTDPTDVADSVDVEILHASTVLSGPDSSSRLRVPIWFVADMLVVVGRH